MNIGALNNSTNNAAGGDLLQQTVGTPGRSGPPPPGLVGPFGSESQQQQQQQQILLDQLNNGGNMASSNANSSNMGMPISLGNDIIATISSNANNPTYHPHLNDRNLLNNQFWKLQLTLSSISLNTLLSGQSNVYARQIALQKKTGRENPMENQDSNSIDNNKNGDITLVDKTKQLLMDIAIDKDYIGNNNNSNNNNSNSNTILNDTDTATTTANNSNVSTPLTPAVDLNNTNSNIPLQLTLLQNKKLSQFNIDDDDDEIELLINKGTDKENIMKRFKYNEQLWHSLDLSNLQLLNLNLSLFNYKFLTRLYLNGNGITYLPKEIKNLNNLRVLDLSNNKIAQLPSELGFCFRLKYLYLFNNQINQLPWELGNLYNLQFLGIEGNPLDPALLKILTEKSMTGLIFYLRDNRPEVPLVNGRKFIEISKDGEPIHESDTIKDSDQYWKSSNKDPDLIKKSFTILQYNTLCQHYATPKMYRYTPSWALAWEYRRNKLKEQILSFNCDIICLQEVEAKTFEDFWSPLLQKHGYSGLFHAKTRAKLLANKDSKKVDGCCIFYKTNKFKMLKHENVDFSSTWMKHKKFQRTEDYLNRAMNKDNVALLMKLQHIQTGESVWCVTTHLHWDPKFNDVKTFQVGVLLDHLQTLIKEDNQRQDVKKVPMIICGDFNSYLDSAVYELLSTGSVKNHPDGVKRDYGYMSQGSFSHQLALSSSYGCIGELPFTNFTPSFVNIIDYIWYSSNALRVRGLLGKIDEDYVSKFIGFPNDKFPSDHLPLLTRFEFLKNSINTRSHSNINNVGGNSNSGNSGNNSHNHNINNSNNSNNASMGSRKV
ncbi:Glucose-repressible alcohol dehydrogenase transcriptional effector [Monosporozyma unispora]|nr:Glucose-repressible alcohol dehydrogenase transcriptional effector [Kazachstania unispora]